MSLKVLTLKTAEFRQGEILIYMNKKNPSYENEFNLGFDDEVDEVKQYYLIETFKQEQIVGQIQEEKIGSVKFMRVDVPSRYGHLTDYSKYLAANTVASLTPISKTTAVKLVNSSFLVQQPVNKQFSFGLNENVSVTVNDLPLPRTSPTKIEISDTFYLGSKKAVKGRLMATSLLLSICVATLIIASTESMDLTFGLSLLPIGLMVVLMIVDHFDRS